MTDSINCRGNLIGYICFSFLFMIATIFCGCLGDRNTTIAKSIDEQSIISSGGKNCGAKLSDVKLKKVQEILTYIQSKVNAMEYCDEDYNPGNHCDAVVKIGSTCKHIFGDLQSFFKKHPSLTFCIGGMDLGDDWLAAVDVNESVEHMYLSEKFFLAPLEEQQRTMIHELYHLWGNNAVHPDDKNCIYYKNWTLKAEHCLTCKASLYPEELSSCAGKNGLFIIKTTTKITKKTNLK